MALASFADLKALMSLEKALASDYPALELLMVSVDEGIREYLGREIAVQTDATETLHIYSKTQMIPLPALPVTSVTSVTVDGTALTSDDYVITDYGLRLDVAVMGIDVVVVYTGGPASTPANWNRAALLQTAYEYQSKDHIGAESVSIEGGAVTRPALQLIPEVRRMLDRDVHPLKMIA